MIGSHTAITSLTHDHGRERMQDTLIKREVVIEDDVWIGTHAIIMPGVTVGRGAVVGAGCVVTKDVAPYSVVVGIPGELLKMREPMGSLSELLLRRETDAQPNPQTPASQPN